MELWCGPFSAFSRKVLVVAYELGIVDRLRLIKTDPREDCAALTLMNPLGKIPVLIREKGDVLIDSPVICEFLNSEYGGQLIPEAGEKRWRVLTFAAIADGITDAGMLLRGECLRPDHQQLRSWIDAQHYKVNAGLDRIQSLVAEKKEFNYGHIAAACAIGWLEFRLPDLGFLATRPDLDAWFRNVSRRESLMCTMHPSA